jgi:Fe2+ transport system protein FeoA
MRKSEPFGGPLTVVVEGSEHAISRELAERIGVS